MWVRLIPLWLSLDRFMEGCIESDRILRVVGHVGWFFGMVCLCVKRDCGDKHL